MTRRERVLAAVNHKQPDKTPWVIWFTQPAQRKLEASWGTSKIWGRIGNHVDFLDLGLPGHWAPARPEHWIDEFGVSWNRTVDKDIGNPEDFILQRMSLDEFKCPDAQAPRRYEALERYTVSRPDSFVLGAVNFSLFERAWTLRGMEQLLIDMATDEKYVQELLEKILEYNIALIDNACRYDIDGIYTGDDWGQQQGLIMGPTLWRKLMKPVLRKMYARIKSHGKFVAIHTCGDVQQLLPDLVEIGVDILNPFQPEVMDVRKVKEEFGRGLCFWGGVSIQKTLPYGTPLQVTETVEGLIRDIGRGGGYILAPAHSIPGDVPVENIIALINAANNQ